MIISAKIIYLMKNEIVFLLRETSWCVGILFLYGFKPRGSRVLFHRIPSLATDTWAGRMREEKQWHLALYLLNFIHIVNNFSFNFVFIWRKTMQYFKDKHIFSLYFNFYLSIYYLFIFYIFFLESGSPCVALAVLALTL